MSRRAVLVALATVSLLSVPVPAYAAVPGAPAAVAAGLGPGRTRVVWEPATDDGGSAATGYTVYRVADGGPPAPLATLGADAREYVDVAAPIGPLLSYGVAQVNADGTGEAAYSTAERAPAGELVFNAWTGASTGAGPVRVVTAQAPGGDARFAGTAAAVGLRTPAVSPGGKQIVYAKPDGGDDYDLFVRAADGTGGERRLTSASAPDLEPTWSPDGKTIAFTRDTAGEHAVYVVPAAGGTPRLAERSARHPAWLADSRTLLTVALGYPGNHRIVRRAPGDDGTTALPGAVGAHDLSVSPNGRWVAYTYEDGPTARRWLAIAPTDGSAPPKVLKEANADLWDPTWRGDGRALYASRMEFSGDYAYQLASFSWDGSTLKRTAAVVTSGLDDKEAAYRAVGLGFTSAPYATRTTATMTFAVTAPYTAATCRLDNGPATDCSSGTWSKAGLARGKHTLTVTATRSGYPSRVLAHTWTADLTAPVMESSNPTRGVSTTGRAVYRYRATDWGAGVKSYDVRYRRARYDGGYGAYVYPSGWSRTTATTKDVATTAGYEYCFSARARDNVGNLSAWSGESCVAAPVDDTAFSGPATWSRVTASGYYRSTYTHTTASGVALTRPGVQARQLVLVATRCKVCGSVTVYHAGVRLGSFDLAAATTRHQVPYWLDWSGALRSGPVRIVTTSPAGKLVRIDGLAAIRQ